MTPCIRLLYLELSPLLPHMVWRTLIHPLKPSFKVRLLFLFHPLAPRAFPGHLVPPPLPACPRASYSKPTLCFHWISLSTFRTLSKLASHKWRCCKWAVCRVGGVAGRFPVDGATCCRKRIPPPPPAVSPLIHHRYNSYRNWLPGFITVVHFSWSGFFFFLLTFFLCLCRWGQPSERGSFRQQDRKASISAPALQEGGFLSEVVRKEGFEVFEYLLLSILSKRFVCPHLYYLGKLATRQNIFWLVLPVPWFLFLRGRKIYTLVKLFWNTTAVVLNCC